MSDDLVQALVRDLVAQRLKQPSQRPPALQSSVRKRVRLRRLPTRVFISFDFSEMRFEAIALGRQLQQSPRFDVQNWSLKEAAPERLWPLTAEKRLNRSDVMVIVVDGNTWRAKGVLIEVRLARALGVPIRQIYPARCARPTRLPAPSSPANRWTHDNLKALINVPRRRAA
jgi:hypothetical protein